MWSGGWLKSPSCGQPSWVCSLVFFVQDWFLFDYSCKAALTVHFSEWRRCDWRCLSAHVGQRVCSGIAGFGQLLQRPSSLARCRSSRARMRLYSRRSVVLFLASSYASRRWTGFFGLTGASCVTGGGSRLGLRCFAAGCSAVVFCGLGLLVRWRSMVY